jgi:hypothetical protein
MPKKKIQSQISLLNFPDNGSHFIFYIYALILDNKPCLKVGITEVILSNRIYQYLYSKGEHAHQDKIIETFKLLCVYTFPSRMIAEKWEGFLKCGFKDFPLTENQNYNTEQYKLKQSWKILSECISTKPIFCINIYIHPFINTAVKDILSYDIPNNVNSGLTLLTESEEKVQINDNYDIDNDTDNTYLVLALSQSEIEYNNKNDDDYNLTLAMCESLHLK